MLVQKSFKQFKMGIGGGGGLVESIHLSNNIIL